MTPDERELRRALAARSGAPSPEFRTRLGAALDHARPARSLMPAIALVAVLALTVATIGVLVMSRNARHVSLASPTRISSPSPVYPAQVDLSAPSADVLWALVDGAYLYRSIDGGLSWRQRPLPGEPPYMHISFLDDHDGWIVVDGPAGTQCSFGAAAVWHTTDAGATWQQLVRADQQIASGSRTASGGIDFSQCKDVMSFVDSQHGFLDAWDDNSPPTIYRTSDGGVTWSGARLPDPPGFKTIGAGDALVAEPVRAFGENLLVAAYGMQPDGLHGYVFRSTDGGVTWTPVASLPNTADSFAFVTASRWVLVSPDQTLETVDAGRSWHASPSDYTQAAGVPPAIVFVDSLVGYATVRGEIQRTADGGVHWTVVKSPGT